MTMTAATPQRPPAELAKRFVFSYGSNSAAQLEGRLGPLAAPPRAATLRGWRRVFTGHSETWGGGVASLCRATERCVVQGTATALTDAQLSTLDGYEAAYAKETVRVELADERGGECECLECIVYISLDPSWQGPPSEMYIAAIHGMLREVSADPLQAVSVCAARASLPAAARKGEAAVPVVERGRWAHPGDWSNLGLPALLVELNLAAHGGMRGFGGVHAERVAAALFGGHAGPPRAAPQDLLQIEGALHAMGLATTEELRAALRRENGDRHRRQLEEVFSGHELAWLRRALRATEPGE